MKVAVVGAGISGASAALELAKRGHVVTLLEQFAIGHTRGSSHGRSRIVRKAYPDAFYTEIMLEGYPMWHELDASCTEPILHECGLMYFGSSESPDLRSVVSGLQDLGVPHSVHGPGDARGPFPTLALQTGEVGVFTADAGWVNAERAVAHSVAMAQGFGAELRHERVDSLEELERVHDAVVLCAGAWNARFLDLPVTVTLQTFAYVEAECPGPVWIEDGPLFLYGFPSEPGAKTVKIGVHETGPSVDPDDPARTPNPAHLQHILAFAERRLRVANPRIGEAVACLYTRTENEDFLLGRVSDKTVFASACSGHGFKFGPWVGRTLAEFVDGQRDPSAWPRLACSPARKN